LNGATRTLKENQNLVVAFEYSPESMIELGFEPEELLRAFENSARQLYVVGNRTVVPLTAASLADALPKRGYLEVLAVPPIHKL
jgi:hypothetical protein